MSMYDERIAKLKKQQNENSQSLKTSQAGSMYDERIAAIKASENPSAKANADIISLFSEKYREDQQKRTENAKRFQEERQEFKSRHGSNVDLMKFDLDAGQKEIDKLEAELARLRTEKNAKALDFSSRPYAAGQVAEDAQYTTGYGITNNRPYAAGLQAQQNIEVKDDPIRELEMQIAKKKQDFNLAKQYQKEVAYDDTVKNADFDQYDDYAESDDTLYNWINNPQFRESYEASYQNIPNPNARRSKYIRKGYDRMRASEIAIYNYYYAKSGKEAAQKYLDTIQERLNERTAEEMYSTVQDDVAAELVFGAAAGFNQFGTNVANNFRFKDDYIPQSAYQIASGMVREDLADNGPKLPKVLGGASLGQIAYDSITTTANMAPSILASYAVAAAARTLGLSAKAARTVGSYAGNTAMGLSAAGGAYQQALNEGYDKNQARGYSILVGASEMAMEKLLGGISAVGGNALGRNAVKNIANADTALKAIAKRVGGSALSEFGEEYLQEVLDPVFSNIMLKTDKEVKPISAEALYSGILGMLTGAFMEAPSAIYGEAQTARTGSKLKEAGGVDSLAKIGNTFAADTVAYKLAGKVNENTGAYTIGQLLKEVDATLTEQNVNEIAEALMKEGVGEIAAKKYAEAFAYVVEGGAMPDSMVNAIKADTVLAKAAREVLIDANTTWNQRTQGYNEVLRKLAMDKVTGKKSSKVTPATDQKSLQVDKNSLTTAEESAAVENENAPSGAQTVEGRDIHTGTQEAVSTDKIKSITKDGVVFAQEDGSEVSSKDVAYADAEDGLIFEAFTEMRELGTDAANEIISIRRKAGGSGQLFANVMRIAYEYGYANLSESGLLAKTYHGNIPTNAVQRIYQIGKEARAAEDARRAQAKKSIVGGKTEVYRLTETGEVKQLGEGKEALKVLAVNERKSVGVKTAQFLQKIGVGGNYYFIQSYTDKDGNRLFLDRNGNVQDAHNGMYYSNGDIYIDLNAEVGSSGITLFTISYELAHFVQQWNAEKYKVLADFLAKHYAKNGTSAYRAIKIKQQTLSEARGTKVSFEEAYHEFVADSLSTMFSDGNIYEKLLDLKKTDKFVFDKIRSYINKLAQKAKAYYSGEIAPTMEGQFMQMQSKETIDQLQQLFADALVGASENYRNAETQKNTDQEVGMQYSDSISSFKKDKYFESQIKKWEELKHGSYVKVGTLGKSHPIVQVGMPEGALRYDVSKLKKNMQDHGDYLTSDLLAVIPDIISNPVVITEYSQKNTISVFGEYFVGKSPMMVGITISRDRAGNDISKVRTFNARRDVGQQITDNTVLYLGENRKRTLNWFQACGIQVPLGGTKFGFIRSISQNASGVNQNSDVNSEPVSNRSLLANAMESLAKTDLEKKKLTEYKAKIDQINAEEQKLSEGRAQIKELSFAKGPRDKEKLRALRDEAIKLSHHIGIYDKQLLRLEASKPLQNVLDREKAKAYQRGREKGEAALKEYKQKAMTEQEQMKKRYEESRKRSVENRNKTAMRHKIRKTIRELDKLLNRGSKERNVKEGMRDFVAEALASAEVLFIDDYSNEDIIRNGVGCDTEPWESKLIDETQVLMQRKKDLYIKSAAMHEVDDVIAGNTVSFDARQKEADKLDRKIAENMRQLSGVFARERARLNRATVSSMLENLAKAYKSLGQSDDLYIRAATDEVVYQHLLSLSEQMNGATVKDMTLKQLKELDKAYTMVLTTVQNANKVFREGRAQQLSQIVRLVQLQIQSISASEKDPTAAKEKIAKWIRSFSWNELHPVDAFERLGSDSFTELFWDVIDAQGEYGKLVRECADMVTKTRKTANYAKWDMKSATTFKTVDGKEFKLTLGDLMSVYAYSKREQAYDHMTGGGFDVGSSSGLKGYIGTEETAWNTEKAWKAAQDFFGWGAMQMDRIGWTVISIANGYTVERPDLALISDLIAASNKVAETISDEEKREKMTPQDWYDLAKNHVGAICNFMGAPAANIIRDVEGAIRFVGDLTDDIYPAEMKESFKRGFSGNEEPKRETLYEAIVADDTGRINVLKKSYVDEDGKFNESAYSSAIRKALREYDPRVQEAAQAYFDSDLDRYNEIFDDIFHEDHFEHNDIHAAIMSEVGELEKKNAPEEVEEEDEEEKRPLYSAESYFNALLTGNKKSANLAYDRLVEAELDEGYLSYEAENNVKSALASQIGSAYKDGKINRETALKLLKENTDKDETDVKKWDFEIKFGYPWSGRDRAYRKGVISESKLIDAIMDIEDESLESAKAYIKFIELAADHSNLEITADDAADYYEFAQPAKISLEAYMEFKEKTSALTVDKDKNGQTINGSKKKKVMDLINAMSLSVHQKDALYYAAGYKESTIDEAPWH